MSITITEQDVGRTVVRRNGEKVKITRWHNDLSQQVEVGQSTLHNTDGFWLTTRKESERDIIAFANEPAAAPAAVLLTEGRAREMIREIVREMMQPQPEPQPAEKETRRGEVWVAYLMRPNGTIMVENGDRNTSSKEGVLEACKMWPEYKLVCLKLESWTEGEGLEGKAS